MVLNDLTTSGSVSTDTVKEEVTKKLGGFLPEGSYSVIVRNLNAGNTLGRTSAAPKFNAMVLLKPEGRAAAIQQREPMEAAGFRVSPSGDIRVVLHTAVPGLAA